MKTKQKIAILALAALVTGTSHAAITGKSSGFMDKRQLAAWRAEAASNVAVTKQEEPGFFTGKPYLGSTDSYAFKFRNYNPSVARWTSEDPSGFPDGANNAAYRAVPTTELDWLGLLTVNVATHSTGNIVNGDVTMVGTFHMATTTKGNSFLVFKVNSVPNPPPNPPVPGVMHDYTQNCHGYTFLPGYWLNNSEVSIVLADEWTLTTNEADAKIVIYGSEDHSARVFSHESNGDVKDVIGKNGYTGVVTLPVDGTGYTGKRFYE